MQLPRSKYERWQSIDLLKGVGVVAMVTIHCVTWWYIYPTFRLPAESEELFILGFLALGAFVLFLPLTGGVALWYMARRAYNQQTKNYQVVKSGFATTMLFRGVMLAVLGIVMNIVAWGWESAWLWNVLQFYALALICITVVLGISGLRGVWALGILSFVAAWYSEVLQSLFSPTWLSSILIGNPSDLHIWPLVPWLFTIILGFAVAEWYQRAKHLRQTRQLLLGWFIAGMTVFLVSLLLLIPNRPQLQLQFSTIWDFSDQPPMFLIMAMVSAFFIFLPVIEVVREGLFSVFKTSLESIGRAVLPIYLLHMPSSFWYFTEFTTDMTEPSWLLLGLSIQYGLIAIVSLLWLQRGQAILYGKRLVRRLTTKV